jgi:hypothetical protein
MLKPTAWGLKNFSSTTGRESLFENAIYAMPLIRPAQMDDAFAMARVHVDTWRTSYVGIVPDEHLAGLSYERCQANWIEHLSRRRDGICG